MHAKAQLYDSRSIDILQWPKTEDGLFAENFLIPLIKNGISHYVDNIQADIYALKIDHYIFPVIVTTENYSNSWVCSPYAHYISYGKESVGLVENPLLAKFVKNLMTGLGKVSRSSKMNSVVYVNNWLFSTDLYPDGLNQEQIDSVVGLLTHRFPQHALVLRSLNDLTTASLMTTLKTQGFRLIASRYVFITDAKNESIFKTRIVKSDLKLWNEHAYQFVDENELEVEESKQLLDLYLKLYVHQHSHLQPQFNVNYFKMLFEKKLLHFKVLKLNGVIKGMAGYYKRSNVMMCPLFGYEKNEAESNTIYRLLNTALLLEAKKAGLLFNQSAGAAFFKSVRRADGCLEYMAIYTRHLPAYRKLFWSSLKLFINQFGSKYMKKY